MQETSSPQEGERLQRAVLALVLDTYPSHVGRRLLETELGDTLETHAAVRHLVRARLIRWEGEALAVTVPALVFDRLAL